MKFVTPKVRPGLFVSVEELLDGGPQLSRGLPLLHGEVGDVIGDGAKQPAADAAVCLNPCGVVRTGSSAVDVCHEAELAAHGCEEQRPLGVVRCLQMEGERHV